MDQTPLHGSDAVAAVRTALRGSVVLPGDPDFDAARVVWNGMHDLRPAAIIRAAGVADVITAVRFGREHDLPLAVRGGGHGVAGYGTVEGGLVIDLGAMRSVLVDPARRVVRVEPGVTLGDLDRETEPFGLVVPVGVVSATGVAGLTLGGGVGWLTRAHGLSVDNLLAADVVTADGRLVRASADEEPELFWGLRGGGGNFGIVTSFEFRAHPLGPNIFGATFIYRRSQWTMALRAWVTWTAGLPDELTSIVSFITPPTSWDLGDETLLFIGSLWAGSDPAGGEVAVAPLRAAAPPDVEVVEPVRWVDWQSAADEIFPKGVRAYWKNASFEALDDVALEAIVAAAGQMPSARTGLDIHHFGGAMSRVAEDATAFPNRSANYWANWYAVWDTPAGDESCTAWARRGHAAVGAHAGAGEYVNFLGASAGDPDSRQAAVAAYGEAKLRRLCELKAIWDPDNIFRRNHNIEPAEPAS